ncbi:hypothetical protein CTEN210_02799 [Chaetoceros tenuissimus]|uniref:Uncharacterized protein n=1 Tax=Chaetoceros tenuissimus TaxID=426638 RepID=A0AAD3H0Y1_9STRA|nr:hypothetical protein CTEN210_02799 [Chaetoceros tenuissimus]
MAITKNDSTSKEGLDDEYDTCDYVNIASAIPVPNPNTSEASGITRDNYSFTPSETGVDYNQYTQHDSTKEDSTKYQNSNQIGAGVVAAVIAMPLLGPVFATAAGVAAAYGTTQDGPAGDACRAAGDVALIAKEKAFQVNEKHHIVEKTKSGAQDVISQVQNVNGRQKIFENIGEFFSNSLKEIGNIFNFAVEKVKNASNHGKKKCSNGEAEPLNKN